MSLFLNGMVTSEQDFFAFAGKTDLSRADAWLNTAPFQSQMYCFPKGSGKTTFLRHCLPDDKRKALALTKKLIIKDCPLSTSFLHSDADVFCCLSDAIVNSVSILEDSAREHFRDLFRSEAQKKEYEDYRHDKVKAFEYIKSISEFLKDEGYFVVLVIDDFHLLTCSDTCAVDTFNNMAYLDQKNLLGYIVFSDYHVSIGSEAYRLSEFERILHINQDLSRIRRKKRWTALLSKVHSEIRKQEEIEELEPEEMFDISEEEFGLIIKLTDGIPGLVQKAVDAYFAARLEKDGDTLTPDEFWNVVYEGCKPLMREWIRYLKDTAHWDTLHYIYDNRQSDSTTALERKQDKSSALISSGLIRVDTLVRSYEFACPLFERFIAEELQRPFSKPSEVEQVLNAVRESGGAAVINIDQSSHNNTVTIKNAVIAPGLTVGGILKLLGAGDSRENYANALAEQFAGIRAKALPLPIGGIAEDDVNLQMQQDTVFDEFGSQVVQDFVTDENQDIIDVNPEELDTLDRRFCEARSRYCRADVTDAFLNALSERCQFYLKLSVVVEDALNITTMEDCSPQLVLYGKLLEQSLRDNFYDLFQSDATLSAYKVDNQNTPFSNVPKERSYISSYQFIIRDNAHYLSRLADSQGVRFQNQPLSVQWWKSLKNEINEARLIRNMADHAGSQSPTHASVDKIFDCLAGTNGNKGILLKANVGRYLMNCLSLGDSSVAALLNSDTCEATVAEIKDGGRLRCEIDGCSIAVRISQKKVQKYRMANPHIRFTEGMKITVKILGYSNNDSGDFLIARIVSV